MISYLQNLGGNDSLNLRHLTLKTVILLALIRPSRSADLAKLDIQWMFYQADGVTFQPAHLAKQSRSSKHFADFFFPLFKDDPVIMPCLNIEGLRRMYKGVQRPAIS